MRRADAARSRARAPERHHKAGKRERYRKLVARRERAEERHLGRLAARFKQANPTQPVSIRLIPKWVWALACAVVNDESGKAARVYLRRARNKVAAGAIRRAALVPQDAGGALYSWSDGRARHIAALGLALLAMEAPTRRKGPWEGVVRGIPRGALCALLANAWTRRRPSISGLAGTHRHRADLQSGQVGYLRALELAGFCYRQQLPVSQVEPFERWSSGYSSNRYWIVTSVPTRPLSDEQKLALMELHRAGQAVAEERLERVRRPRVPRRSNSENAAEAAPS